MEDKSTKYSSKAESDDPSRTGSTPMVDDQPRSSLKRLASMTPMCKYSFSCGDSESDEYDPPSKAKKTSHEGREKVKEVKPVQEKDVLTETPNTCSSAEKKNEKSVTSSKNNTCEDKIDETSATGIATKSKVVLSTRNVAEKERSPSPSETVVKNKEKDLKIKQIFERRSSSCKSDNSSRSDKSESRKSEENRSNKTRTDSKTKSHHSSSKKGHSISRKLPSECFAEAREKAIRNTLSGSSAESSPRSSNVETPVRAIIASIPLKSL
jgi:hypothetical protein